MDALQSLSLDKLQSMLAEAIEARHKLLTRPTSASSHNRSITYAQQVRDADAYINRLQAAVQAKESGGRGLGGPIYLIGGGR